MLNGFAAGMTEKISEEFVILIQPLMKPIQRSGLRYRLQGFLDVRETQLNIGRHPKRVARATLL